MKKNHENGILYLYENKDSTISVWEAQTKRIRALSTEENTNLLKELGKVPPLPAGTKSASVIKRIMTTLKSAPFLPFEDSLKLLNTQLKDYPSEVSKNNLLIIEFLKVAISQRFFALIYFLTLRNINIINTSRSETYSTTETVKIPSHMHHGEEWGGGTEKRIVCHTNEYRGTDALFKNHTLNLEMVLFTLQQGAIFRDYEWSAIIAQSLEALKDEKYNKSNGSVAINLLMKGYQLNEILWETDLEKILKFRFKIDNLLMASIEATYLSQQLERLNSPFSSFGSYWHDRPIICSNLKLLAPIKRRVTPDNEKELERIKTNLFLRAKKSGKLFERLNELKKEKIIKIQNTDASASSVSTTLTSSGIANASLIAETLTTLKDKDQTHLSGTEYKQIVSGLSFLNQAFKTITKQQEDIGRLNELHARDPIALTEIAEIDKDLMLKTHYDSLRIHLYQLFIGAIAISSGNIKVDSGFSSLATKGLGMAITQGAIHIGVTVTKGIPVASIFGAAIESMANFAIERNQKIDLRKLAQIAQVRESTPELLAQELARKITYGQQKIIRDSSKSGQGSSGLSKLKAEVQECAAAMKKFIKEKVAGRQLNPIQCLAEDTVVDLMVFAASDEFKGLETRQAVVNKALQLLNIQYTAPVKADEPVSSVREDKYSSSFSLVLPPSELSPDSYPDMKEQITQLNERILQLEEKSVGQEKELKQLRQQPTVKTPGPKDISSGNGNQVQIQRPEEEDPPALSSPKIIFLEQKLCEAEQRLQRLESELATGSIAEVTTFNPSNKNNARSSLLKLDGINSVNSTMVRQHSPLVQQSLISSRRSRAETQQSAILVDPGSPLILLP